MNKLAFQRGLQRLFSKFSQFPLVPEIEPKFNIQVISGTKSFYPGLTKESNLNTDVQENKQDVQAIAKRLIVCNYLINFPQLQNSFTNKISDMSFVPKRFGFNIYIVYNICFSLKYSSFGTVRITDRITERRKSVTGSILNH